jgi:Mg2+/Co2+ transporter CorB
MTRGFRCLDCGAVLRSVSNVNSHECGKHGYKEQAKELERLLIEKKSNVTFIGTAESLIEIAAACIKCAVIIQNYTDEGESNKENPDG